MYVNNVRIVYIDFSTMYIYIYIYSERDFSTICDCMCNRFVIYVNVFVCKQYLLCTI